MFRLHLAHFTPNLPALNSLRVQLVLWIALPVAVSLLGMSMIEIRGHEQAMAQMVQQQADLAASSLGVLIDAHIDQRQAILQQLAAEYLAKSGRITVPESAFSAGVFWIGPPTNTITNEQRPAWVDNNNVVSLAGKVRTGQAPGLITVYDETNQVWLLVQAVSITNRDGHASSTLVGADPVAALITEHKVASLDPALIDEVRLTRDNGDLLYSQTSAQVSATPASVDPTHAGHDAARWVTGQTTVVTTGWHVTVSKDWRVLVPPVLTFGNVALVIVGVAVALSVLSAYFGLRNIVWPLQRLARTASQIGWGNFAAIHQSVGGVTEIEELRLSLARMTDQLRLYQQDLQSYIGAMTLGQEEERRRLARELHDETVQDLIALNQKVEMVERELGRDPQRAATRLRELRPLVTAAIDALRRQIQALRPLYLEDLGFVSAIEMLVHQVTQRSQLTSHFTITGDTDIHLAPALQTSAYRIVQEAIQNVIKHAAATDIHVALHFATDSLTLSLTDNGHGFTVPDHPYHLSQTGHFGLLGMKERAQLHGGTLQIDSQPSQGTTVLVYLPLYAVTGSAPASFSLPIA